MRICISLVALACFLGRLDAAEDPAVLRARTELNRVTQLVDSGVLPRARQIQAQDALADAQDDSAIRNALYLKDITPEQADEAVALTQKRIDRRLHVIEERNKLVADGILARSELADYQSALEQAQTQHTWAIRRAELARELVQLARSEQEMMQRFQVDSAAGSHSNSALAEHFVGSNRFNLSQFPVIEKAFEARFAHALPVSAMGETEVHKALGFDHRNRVDIALPPDLPEGLWLRHYLTSRNIPFFAFRAAVVHQATGAHIHIGPPSERYIAQAAKTHSASGE